MLSRETLLYLTFLVSLLIPGGGKIGAEEARAKEAGEASPPKMLVILKPTVGLDTPFARLGDVSELPNDPLTLRARGARIFLGLTPKAGETRSLTRAEVLEILRLAGFPTSRIELRGAEKIVLYRLDGPGRDRREAPGFPAGETARASAKSQPGITSRSTGSRGTRLGSRNTNVERGAQIMVRSESGLLRIEEPAEALQSGRIGEVILVKNPRTGLKRRARVTGESLVVILAPGAPARVRPIGHPRRIEVSGRGSASKKKNSTKNPTWQWKFKK